MSKFPEKPAPLPGVRHILLVGSGKGGVGKSTVALNLSVALSKKGFKAGILDGDLYGPSLPRLTGSIHIKPALGENKKIIPLRRYGVSLISMGHLVDEESPLIWRGPMLFKAIEQFFGDVVWGDLDVLIIDLPPGTGDVALSVAQRVPVSGGIVVCTPQNLALLDARKALNMFRQMQIPIIGVVENMSYYLNGKEEKIDLFPRGQMDIYLREKNIEKLCAIPFHPHIGLSGEAGVPLLESYPDSKEGKAILLLAEKVQKYLERRTK